jgi:hypothetical protein
MPLPLRLHRQAGGTEPSNRGPAVDVSAPGENIAGLDQIGTVTLSSGTSFAMPLAAGVAGLLKSFLPSLAGTALKATVLAGAWQTVATDAGARPVLYAYGALKKAAERPGAPLCGNVMLTQYASTSGGTTTVKVRRQTGQPYETIAAFTVPSDTVVNTDLVHGGKQLLRFVPSSPNNLWQLIAQHNGTSWQQLPPPWAVVSNPNLTGSSNSWHAWSHNADSVLHASISANAGFQSVNLSFNFYTGGTNRPAFFTLPNLPNAYVDPTTGFPNLGAGGGFGVPSPTGDFAILATHTGTAFGTLNFSKVAIPSGVNTPLFSDQTKLRTYAQCQANCGPAPHIGLSLSISEDGTEFWYLVPTVDFDDFQAGCALKRYSLKTATFISIDAFTGAGCIANALGSARVTSAIPITSR